MNSGSVNSMAHGYGFTNAWNVRYSASLWIAGTKSRGMAIFDAASVRWAERFLQRRSETRVLGPRVGTLPLGSCRSPSAAGMPNDNSTPSRTHQSRASHCPLSHSRRARAEKEASPTSLSENRGLLAPLTTALRRTSSDIAGIGFQSAAQDRPIQWASPS
jgi:hypothetical protein